MNLNDEIVEICQKIECISDKYNICFMDVMNKIMMTHVKDAIDE